ncbi:gamma-glutamyltransferase family protein [Actinophytocola sp.]|uniref:gamma-glutamyltransferase family protein n=1 Tax=Actinophytocola sp. TaxID=1872138 RepID=UPI003D6A6774
MTDGDIPHPRRSVLSADGMVSSSHPAVSFVGARTLAAGGNAVDATLAMAAMSWLALPAQCGVGGDAFAVVLEPDGTVWTVGGSGFGPDGGTAEFYRDHGLNAVPLEGALAVAVPGGVAAMHAMHTRSASMSQEELWAPALAAAERGMPCTFRTHEDIRDHREALAGDPGTAEMFLPNGAVPPVGMRLPKLDLANSMRELAKDPLGFYTGVLAERAVAVLGRAGAPFSGAEWAAGAHVALESSVTGRYRDLVVHQTPSPSPGWMLLQQAAICDGQLASREWLSAESVHWMAGSARVAFRDRWEHCGSDNSAWRTLLGDAAVAKARAGLAAGMLATAPGIRPGGDTTSMVAVDMQGRAVSFIHSLAFPFGARMTVPGTGIVLNNRLGRGAYLAEDHPNGVRPRRKPLHTLNAWLATDSTGHLIHVGNTPGGDGQVQWNMQILSHLADHGLGPQDAVTAPRFVVFPGSDADVVGQPEELRCESRMSGHVLTRLTELGHRVRVVGPWAAGGSAVVITADHERGCLSGGADPRQDGIALGGCRS